MAASTTHVDQAITVITQVSQDTGKTAEDVSAAAEEMSVQLVDMTQATQALRDIARELQDSMSNFQLEEVTPIALVPSPALRRAA